MNKLLAAWLLACCALLLAVLALGGVTRLTRSGLSIVDWEPVSGVLPPATQEQWQQAFARYQATPEYRTVNLGMDLEGFKSIYWMEYAHRLLARAAGLFFALPFLLLALLGRLKRPLLWRLGGVAALWALQGALGWYMVSSGLVLEPRVSHLRLTAHLLAAVALYVAMLWTALGLLRPTPEAGAFARARFAASALLVVVAAAIASGGLVAGLRAGLAFNTFPKMGDAWIPPYWLRDQPAWRNFLYNAATVQFDHRVLAGLTVAGALALLVLGLRAPAPARAAIYAAAGFAALQAVLGVATLLWRVPTALAAAHQVDALLLLAAALAARYELRAA